MNPRPFPQFLSDGDVWLLIGVLLVAWLLAHGAYRLVLEQMRSREETEVIEEIDRRLYDD